MREPGLTHGRLSRILYSRGINWLIFASHVREIDAELRFDWKRFSAVKIDNFSHHPELHNVTNNQMQVVRLAMQKVIEAGYKRIGFVMDDGWDITVDHLWCAGYLWEQQKLEPKNRIPPYLFPNAEPFAKRQAKHRPEAIVSKAEFALPRLSEIGTKVPKDVFFVDIFLEDFKGVWAGVRQNHASVGGLAVELLAGQLQHNKFGIPEISTTTYVEATWFDGASCPMPRGA
jgi:LacI family transcriptional regulator